MVSKVEKKYDCLQKAKIFQKFLKDMNNITNYVDWYNFQVAVMGCIETLYTKKSLRYNVFFNLSCNNNKELAECKKTAKIQLEAIILELKLIGCESNNVASPIIRNEINQNVNQTINTNIVVSILENQLPPVTMNEIKEILKTDEKPEKKKSKILEAVKSTGENILAKIITEFITKGFTGQ